MGLFDFISKPKNDVKNTIQETADRSNQQQNYLDIHTGEHWITLYGRKVINRIQHSDGTITNLIEAKVIVVPRGGTMLIGNATPICFEAPDGLDESAIKNLISQIGYMQLSKNSYTYVGRIYNNYDIRMQPPTNAVNNLVVNLTQKLQQEIKQKEEQQRIENEARIKADKEKEILRTQESIKKNEEYIKAMEEQKQKNIMNPVIKKMSSVSPAIGNYNGTDMVNGQVLRIRDAVLQDKDRAGTYIYSARLSTTQRETDFEYYDGTHCVTVVFTLPYKLSDILDSQYDIQTKEAYKRAILTALSNGCHSHMPNELTYDDRALFDIGGIDKYCRQVSSKRENGIISDKIAKLQRKYEIEKNRSKQGMER